MDVVVPPGHEAQIPIRQRRSESALPQDRHYIFISTNTTLNFYSSVVSSELEFALAKNETSRPITITRRSRLGDISEFDYAAAYQVDPEALPEALPKISVKKKRATLVQEDLNPTTKTPTGVTVYGENKTVKILETVVNSYPQIWKNHDSTANISESNWMRLPIREECMPTKSSEKVYPLDPKDRAAVDEVFDKLHEQEHMF